jgi:acyl-[acyl-carrier-protein]-phospholipid O-acyltransferase/long-chain-fatty-acid--[acyl-carrier-protein] ligase
METPDPRSSSAQADQPALRGFWCLIITQFQGAFSDNVLKNLVIFMMLDGSLSRSEEHRMGELITALFSLPFILFSMAGGFLADRFSKRTVMLGVKIFEILVMLFALAGFVLRQTPMLVAGIFLMGTHSAFFGPSKYGSLPELLPERRLSWGNGILELGTFVAIILGTVAASVLAEGFGRNQVASGWILLGLAAVGLVACLGITRVPAADPARRFGANFIADVIARLRPMRGDRPLVLAMIGNIYFSFLGSLLILNLFFYGDAVLHVSKLQIGYLNVALALGIGSGSVAAGYLSGGKIEYGLVPLGALGMFAVCASLAAPDLSLAAVLVRLGLLGFAGGFFIVPVSALLQHRPAKEKKGEVLAAANLLSFVGVFLVWPVHYLLAQVAHLTPRHIFLFGGVLTLAGAVYAVTLLPDSLLRFALWVLTHSLYRIKVLGRDNIPAKCGALFVCNHLSQVDALLLLASTDRHVRFIMYKGVYDLPWIKPLARVLGVIPISSELRPREMIHSLREASEAIKNGEVVCIFAEGQITRIGQMLPFRRGFERIMKDPALSGTPIIPVALDGVWGSIFSFEKGRFVWKLPRRIPYPVTVNFGQPLPHTATPFDVRQAVQELMAEAWQQRKERMKPLHHAFVGTARRHPFRFAMADAQFPKVSFGSALLRTLVLARRLRGVWSGQRMAGLLLPPSVPGALANFAAMLLGKVPVNLNYTISEEALASCVRQCEIRTVVTSRAFLEKLKLKLPCETVFLEDVTTKPGLGEKVGALLSAWLLPARWLDQTLRGRSEANPFGTATPASPCPGAHESDRARDTRSTPPEPPDGLRGRARSESCAPGAVLDELATVIFSSGSTGEPKGVMLSHYNIGSNIEQLDQVFGLDRRDVVLGILPFFHSFGFTGTLCLPAALGVGVVYHPNPLDAKNIGPLVSRYAVTFLLATPTFLQLYMRGCSAEDFGSLRLVMTGAEKLPERLSAAFEEQFGIRPLEGYGCTECAPVVAVNTRDFRSAGFRQVGAKRGKIGHPVPGVCARIVDPQSPQSDTPLPVGQPGLLLVRGPNVMQGYLGRPDKTAEVLRDGWYVTGDVAAVDEDGFLQITDRLSRFSKIGGEMVPHIKIEEKLHELAGATEQTFVVTGVPDEKKGERLVVLHKLPDGQLQPCLEKLAQCDLPNLWKPRPDQFFHLDALPYLGTGKLDLRKVREIAVERSGRAV